MKLIDLSHTIDQNTPVYPGDQPIGLNQTRSIEADGFTNFNLTSEMHIGTHIDGPLHKVSGSPLIANLSLDKFTGRGILIDVRGENRIEFRESFREQIPVQSIVLFYSGLSNSFNQSDYFSNYPSISEELAHFLVKKEVKIVGLDWCSPDHHPYPIHEILLRNNILIIENLTNLDQLTQETDFEIFAFPLKLEADSSPLRVVAKII
jgi:kynurenine formamidase